MASLAAQETTPLFAEALSTQHDQNTATSNDLTAKGTSDDPDEWSWIFKWLITALLCFTAFTVSFACTSVVPVASRIVGDLDGENAGKSATVLLVTIWELGEAAGPILIAPLSEVFGRYPLMNTANLFFISATVLAALSQNTWTLITARLLTGMAVGTNVLNPAIVGDMLPPDQQGATMSLILFAPLVGGAAGPVVGGAVTEAVGWRVVLWMSVGLACICEFVFLTCFRETFKPVILRQRLARLRKTGLCTRAASEYSKEEDSDRSFAALRSSISRPVMMLFSSSILAGLSLFGSVTFAYYYVVIVTLPIILQDKYGMSPADIGSAFLATSFGSLVGFLVCNLSLDKIYIKLRARNNGTSKPEHRLPMAIIGAFLMPPSVCVYGWCAKYELSLLLMLSSVICICMSFMLCILPLMSYVVDAYGLYSASALTSVIITRCLVSAFLPLLSALMVECLGYGWGFTVLAAVSLALAFIPVLVLRYGSHWRQRSEYTRTHEIL